MNSVPATRRVPRFQVVEIEVNTRCNLRCPYCPQSYEWFRRPESRMDDALFGSIIGQLAEVQFAGRLSFHLYNEPLLRKDLTRLVAWARESLPLAWLVLYTNGDLLDHARHHALLDAGIDRFLVTRHRGAPLPERAFQEVRFPGEFMLSNRGGLMAGSGSRPLPCHAPMEMLMIRCDGSVVLCHEDAAKQEVIGDARKQSLEEIWTSERLDAYRRALEAGNRSGAAGICANCNNRLHPLPDTSI